MEMNEQLSSTTPMTVDSNIKEMHQVETTLDAAATAAKTIADAAGISDPDAMAQKLIELEGRIKELESAVPALEQVVHSVSDVIPQDWKDKVQHFLSQHLGFRE